MPDPFSFHSLLRTLKQKRANARANARIDEAVHQYGIAPISVARAAAIAGVSFDRMKDILADRGIELRLGPETLDEARNEVDNARQMRS